VLVGVTAVTVLPLVASDYITGIGIQVAIVLGLAQSYDLLVGRTGAFSFAHAAFFGSGSYVTAVLLTTYHVPFLACLVLSIAFATLLGAAIGIPSFRLSLHSFAMGTFGFGAILQLVALNWIPVTRGPLCINGVPPLLIDVGPFSWQASRLADYYYVLWGLAALILVTVWRIARSRIGRALTAVRDDPGLASASGVPLLKYRMFAFLMGGALAAAVGAVVAPYLAVVCPTQLGLPWMVTLIVVVFLGGRGSLVGVTLGAVLFTALPEFLRLADVWRQVIYGALIMVGALYAPHGIAGLASQVRRPPRWVMRWIHRSSR
jgi:ABC-type branched-subunit amino acid transport system permease subunit